ncbi:MAG: hypothetical protein ACW98D_17570, partial [Promethearchaeota archaeon]
MKYTILFLIFDSCYFLCFAQNQPFFIENFDLGNPPVTFISDFYGNISQGQFWNIQDVVTASGTHALQYHFTNTSEGGYVSQHFGDATKSPVYENEEGTSFFEIYIQFKIRYSLNYDWSGGNNKQMIIGTDDGVRHENICCNPWVAHYITLLAGNNLTDGYFNAEGN